MTIRRFFASPAVLLFVLIVLAPIIYMLTAPLWSPAHISRQDNGLLFNTRHIPLALNSLGLALGTTFFCLLIGIPLGFLLSRTDFKGRRFLNVLCIIPLLIPPYVHAIAWDRLSPFIQSLFSLDIHSLGGAVLVLGFCYFPFVALLTQTGLVSIDRNLEEAALLSRGSFKTHLNITLPLLTPYIISGALLVFVFTIINFEVPDFFRVKVYPLEIFIQYSAFYDESAAAILSIPLLIAALVLIIIQKRFMRHRSYVNISAGFSSTRLLYKLGRLKWVNILAVCFSLFILVLSVAFPLAYLIKSAGPFSNYIRALETSQETLIYSIILAGAAAVLTVLLAFPIAFRLERLPQKSWLRPLFGYAALAPLAVPAATLGIGLVKIWNQPVMETVYTSSLIVIFGYTARFIPFALLITAAGIKQISRGLEEAAALVTRSQSKITWKIVVPLTRNSLITSFFFVFILSLGELGTTLLVIPPGRETIPLRAYNLMHYGAHDTVAALCLIQVIVILILSGIFYCLRRPETFLKKGFWTSKNFSYMVSLGYVVLTIVPHWNHFSRGMIL